MPTVAEAVAVDREVEDVEEPEENVVDAGLDEAEERPSLHSQLRSETNPADEESRSNARKAASSRTTAERPTTTMIGSATSPVLISAFAARTCVRRTAG